MAIHDPACNRISGSPTVNLVVELEAVYRSVAGFDGIVVRS